MVGTGVWADSGSENCTVTVASDGTPVAPSTGATETTPSGRVEAVWWAGAADFGVADTLPPVECVRATAPTAATTTRTPRSKTNRRRPRCRFGLACAWAPVMTKSPPNISGRAHEMPPGRRASGAPHRRDVLQGSVGPGGPDLVVDGPLERRDLTRLSELSAVGTSDVEGIDHC